MFEDPGSESCPLSSFEKYLTKKTGSPQRGQSLLPSSKERRKVWGRVVLFGVSGCKLPNGSMLTPISKEAGTSVVYIKSLHQEHNHPSMFISRNKSQSFFHSNLKPSPSNRKQWSNILCATSCMASPVKRQRSNITFMDSCLTNVVLMAVCNTTSTKYYNMH